MTRFSLWRTAILGLCALLLSASLNAQTWQVVTLRQNDLPPQGHFASYHTDLPAFNVLMRQIPQENSASRGPVTTIALPNPEGQRTNFVLEEIDLLQLPPGATPVPVHNYSGYSQDKSEVIHLSTYENRVYGIVLRGSYAWYISTPVQPASPAAPGIVHINVFDDAGRPETEESPVGCSNTEDMSAILQDMEPMDHNIGARPTATPSTACSLRIYRLAVGCAAEYTVASGSQAAAIANLAMLVNAGNAIFERDMNTRLIMVTNNNLIWTDTATDPFSPWLGTNAQLGLSGTTFSTYLNESDYDLGITVFYKNFGGLARLKGACQNGKGKAVGGFNSLNPVSYMRSVVVHEIGHLLGANHSHNSNDPDCSFHAASAWEVGGGATMMAYTRCTPSYASSTSPNMYFHVGNIAEMRKFMSAGGACFTTGATNTTPALSTPSDDTFFIPVSTPYRLYTNATDAEDNDLTYSFEQMDPGTGSTAVPSPTDVTGPAVRWYAPSPRAYRYIPRLDSLRLNIYPQVECLASVPRLFTFWATARDNHPGCGCISMDTFLVKTSGTSPFQVTSHGTPTTLNGGSSATVSWNVAATNLAPFNTPNVQILFATDGLHYDHVLAASVPNNGSATVTVPNLTTSKGRIMVAAVGNIFFDINNADITIQPPCATAAESRIWPQDAVSAIQGAPALQLDLLPIYGQSTDTLGGAIEATDPTGIMGFRNTETDPTCRPGIGYTGHYDIYRFRVAQPGAYTFTRNVYAPLSSLHLSIYGAGGLTPTSAAACNNYKLGSTTFFQTGSTSISSTPSFTFTAQRDSVYTLVALRTGTTNLGGYRIDVTGPAQLYSEVQNAPGNYAYAVVNSAGTVIAITNTPANLQSQPVGTYYVYGISYTPSLNLAPYLNQPFNNLVNASLGAGQCLAISANRVPVTIRPIPLPNDYIKLTASKANQAARLDWQTDGNTGTESFLLEQSSDGSSFRQVRTFGKNEHKLDEHHYSYLHTQVTPDNNYFRIRENKVDGKALYSNIAVVSFSGQPGLTIVPNPATSQVVVKVDPKSLPLPVSLSDMAGRTLRRFTIDRDGYTFSVADLAPGMYLLSGKGFAVKIAKR